MLKKYYYYLSIPIICLLFSSNVFAGSSFVQGSGTTYDGDTIYVRGNSYTSVDYDEVTQFADGNGNYVSTFKYTIVQNFVIHDLQRLNYYNGEMSFMVTATPSVTGTERNSPILQNVNLSNGLHAYINAVGSNYYYVSIVFDNYYAQDTWEGIGTIIQDFYLTNTGQTPSILQNFTYTISNVIAGRLWRSQEPYEGGLAKLITDSIDDSTALAVIAGWLYDMKEADYQYYQGLISQMASILSAQGTTNARLLSILNEIDLDFQQVQTILDLFPSYRTQVLQYWQELLQMNTSQSSEAAEIESQYADRESQSSQLINGMGSLVMPSISSGDLDIMGTVDPNQKANFFGLIALITHNQIITKIMLIIVLGAIVGYILYGKK